MFGFLMVISMVAGGIVSGIYRSGFWQVIIGMLAGTALPPLICWLIKPSTFPTSRSFLWFVTVCWAIAGLAVFSGQGFWFRLLGFFAGGLAYYLLVMVFIPWQREYDLYIISGGMAIAGMLVFCVSWGGLLRVLIGSFAGGIAGFVLSIIITIIKRNKIFSTLIIPFGGAIAGVFLFDKLFGSFWNTLLGFSSESFLYKGISFFADGFWHKALGFLVGGLAGAGFSLIIRFIRKFPKTAIPLGGAIAGIFLFDKLFGSFWNTLLGFSSESFLHKGISFFADGFWHKSLGFLVGGLAGGAVLLAFIGCINNLLEYIEDIKLENNDINRSFKDMDNGIKEKNSELVLAGLSKLSELVASGKGKAT